MVPHIYPPQYRWHVILIFSLIHMFPLEVRTTTRHVLLRRALLNAGGITFLAAGLYGWYDGRAQRDPAKFAAYADLG